METWGYSATRSRVAVSDRFPIQISGQGALELGVILDHPVSVIAVYRGSALFIRFGQGTTDQSQARNADLHIQHPSLSILGQSRRLHPADRLSHILKLLRPQGTGPRRTRAWGIVCVPR